MKRLDLIRHLESFGCEFLREESRHTVFIHRRTMKSSTVPRHAEINDTKSARIWIYRNPDHSTNLYIETTAYSDQ